MASVIGTKEQRMGGKYWGMGWEAILIRESK